MKKRLLGMCLVSLLTLTLNFAFMYAGELRKEVTPPKGGVIVTPYGIDDYRDWV